MTAILELVERIKEKTTPTDTGLLDGREVIQCGQVVELSTLDTSWHPAVETAVNAARKWQQRRRRQVATGQTANASLILAATGLRDADNHEIPTHTGKGCGKTHIALSILWSIRHYVDGVPVSGGGTFYLANDLIRLMDGEGRLDRFLNYRKVWNGEQMVKEPPPILVIDDVGAETKDKFYGGSWDSEVARRYFRIIDHCYNAGISVIVTSNLPLPPLAISDEPKAEGARYLDDVLGGRSWSRLLEMAPAGFMIDMTGVPDWRRRSGGR